MGNQPIKKFVAGSISATIWENETEKDKKKIVFNTVTLQRAYKDKDKDDKWANTQNLRTSDLPKAILVLYKAFEHLEMKEIKED